MVVIHLWIFKCSGDEGRILSQAKPRIRPTAFPRNYDFLCCAIVNCLINKNLPSALVFLSPFRWKRTPDGTLVERFEKRVLEFVALQRQDTLEWVLPEVCGANSLIIIVSQIRSCDSFHF